ncbi:MAG: cellulase family glycosylhydrolase [Planctomycetota bacterium]|nr:cellulase family glycosylhydrolase [Planctomycetota bacterium]
MSIHRLVLVSVVWWVGGPCAAAESTPASTPLPKVRVVANTARFETADRKPFVPIGVNYYRPGTGWAPQLWKKFDAAATRQDFARMKELGVNCVRVFLTYGSFFMDEQTLTPDGLGKFDQLLEIAEAAGIYVHPTGPDHWEGLPAWATADRYADERLLQALENFWKLFAQRYRGRQVIWAYDLLNEPQVPWDTPALRAKWNNWLTQQYGSADKTAEAWHVKPEGLTWNNQPPPPAQDAPGDRRLLDYQHFREEVADHWTRRQVAAIKSADPAALVTVGLIQWSVPALLPGAQHYAGFRPERLARLLDFQEIHFYPLATGFFNYLQPEDEQQNLAYLESVVREVAKTGQPVVVAEFGWYGGGKLTIDGGRHPEASEEHQARWCRRAIETTQGLATGWLNWGFFDQPEAGDVSQLTGLLKADGKPKAWAREFQQIARRLAADGLPRADLGPRPTLDWDPCLTSVEARRQFREAYFEAFGNRPALK